MSRAEVGLYHESYHTASVEVDLLKRMLDIVL